MPDTVRILVVDDDQYLLDLMIETLTTIGYSAVGAASAEEAFLWLEKTDFGLIITDIKMPGMDGIEFARRVKKNYPGIPVIFITGVLGSSVLKNGDAEGLLSKPFRIGQMEELIQNAISGQAPAPETPRSEDAILVVDDDDSFRVMLMETLKLSGYSVIGCENGRTALEIMEKGGVGRVITDIKMPEMDGIELARQIRTRWPQIPIILITGYFSAGQEQAEAARLADGFLMKPFKIESITELLESLKNKNAPPKA